MAKLNVAQGQRHILERNVRNSPGSIFPGSDAKQVTLVTKPPFGKTTGVAIERLLSSLGRQPIMDMGVQGLKPVSQDSKKRQPMPL